MDGARISPDGTHATVVASVDGQLPRFEDSARYATDRGVPDMPPDLP
jgi:hypothetical protein